MASVWSVIEGQDCIDDGVNLGRRHLGRLRSLGSIAGSDRSFRRANLGDGQGDSWNRTGN